MGNSDKPFNDLDAELAAIEAENGASESAPPQSISFEGPQGDSSSAATAPSSGDTHASAPGFNDDLSALPDSAPNNHETGELGSLALGVAPPEAAPAEAAAPEMPLGLPDDLGPDLAPRNEPVFTDNNFTTSPPSRSSPSSQPLSSMDSVRNFSDNVSVGGPTVPASFPFHLWMTGKLEPHERERLLDLVEKEKFGITRDELEMQIDAGRMLLPRISEYAAMIVVQALRSAQIQIRMLTSQEVDASHSHDTEGALSLFPSSQTEVVGADLLHPADQIPTLLETAPPESAGAVKVDTFWVSQVLTIKQVETKDSKEYQELLDAMKRELKHRAYRRGVTHLYELKIDLHPLTLPSSYRLTLQAVGVKSQVLSRSIPSSHPANA